MTIMPTKKTKLHANKTNSSDLGSVLFLQQWNNLGKLVAVSSSTHKHGKSKHGVQFVRS
jgi:hypothetical protein